MTEHLLQLTCIAWFKNDYKRNGSGIIIPVVNEATYKNKTFAICKGASDLIVVLPGKVLFVELKVGINRQSQGQLEFERIILNLYHEYHLVRSLEEFKAVVTL